MKSNGGGWASFALTALLLSGNAKEGNVEYGSIHNKFGCLFPVRAVLFRLGMASPRIRANTILKKLLGGLGPKAEGALTAK
ncbi:hypothetical protein CsSME_00029308 [Camellia sinensis var. sinensis]